MSDSTTGDGTSWVSNTASREQHTQHALAQVATATDPDDAAHWRELAVEANYEMARRVARRYAGRGMDTEDLQQVALLALIKAVDRYRPEAGSFTAYAVSTILGELKRHFRDKSYMIRPPRRLYDAFREVATTAAQLQQTHGCTPSNPDLARELQMTPTQLNEARTVGHTVGVLSLDALQPVNGSGSYDGPAVPDIGSYLATHLSVRQAVRTLPAPDQHLLRLRFEQDLTQSQIAPLLGISQMQVSRRLTRVLHLLRDKLGENFPLFTA